MVHPIHRKWSRRLSGALVAVACISCGSESAAPGVPACDQVTVVVIPGDTPTFEWSPKCRAARLDVHDAHSSDTGLVWGATTWVANELEGPVVYGIMPDQAQHSGGANFGPAPALTPGRRYRVALFVHHRNPEIFWGEHLFVGGAFFVQ